MTIAAGSHVQTKALVDAGAAEALVRLINIPDHDVANEVNFPNLPTENKRKLEFGEPIVQAELDENESFEDLETKRKCRKTSGKRNFVQP